MRQHRWIRIDRVAGVAATLRGRGAAGGAGLDLGGGLAAAGGDSLGDSTTVDSTATDSAVDSARPRSIPPPRPLTRRSGRLRGSPRAQPQVLRGDTTVVVDRVLAVVANRPVLASQVDEEIFSRQAQGAKLPTDPAQLDSVRRQVISTIVDEELLVQQASRDTSIHVTDQEIADGVEQQVRKVRGNFSSELDYRNELKKAGFQTPEEYRRWLTDQQRRAALQNRLIDKLKNEGKLKPVPPTEAEMRAYFDAQQGQPGQPAGHHLLPADRRHAASRAAEAKARTKAQADSIVLELRRGADFATRGAALLAGPGLEGPGRLAQLVPPGRDGARVRAGRLRAQARRRSPTRSRPPSATTSSRWSALSRPRSRPATSCWCRRSIRPTCGVPTISPPGSRRCFGRARRSTRCSGSTTTRRASARRTTCRRTSCPSPTPRRSAPADSGTMVPVFTVPGAGNARAVRGAPGDRPPLPGRHPLRRREGPHPAAAQPGAGDPPAISTTSAKPRYVEIRMLSRPRLAVTLGDPRGIGPEITAAALASPLDAEVTLVGAEDQIADRCPRDRRVPVGTWGQGSGDSGDRGRALRAGRIAGHAVEDRRPARAGRRGGRDRHRPRAQARAASRGLSLSRAHRVAGAARRRTWTWP